MNSVAKALLIIALSALALAVLASPGSSAEDTPWTDVDSESGLNEALNGGAKNIRIVSDITLAGDLNIPAGVKVLIPYGADDTSGVYVGGETFKIAGSGYVYRTVTLSGNLTVSGELIIGGVIGNSNTFSYQGHTSGGHSVLVNNGSIAVKAGGSVSCFGFVRGTGEIVAESGSTVTEPVVITDYTGGDNLMSSHNANQAIFNRYSISNIRCPLQIGHGAALLGKVAISVSGMIHENQVTYIGDTATFIRLSEGASARLTYSASPSIESSESLGLHSDIGKTTVTITGGATFEAMEILVNNDFINARYSFAEHPFPLPYTTDMVLENGNYLMNEDFRILPGAKLTVGADATLAVNNSLSVFWGLEDKTYKDGVRVDMKYPSTSTLGSSGFDKSGRLIVNGSLILLDNADFSGIAEMGSASASITTSKRTDCTLKTVEHGCNRSDSFSLFMGVITKNWNVDTLSSRQMAGYIVDSSGNLAILLQSSVYRAGDLREYTMENYVQDGTTYALGSVFKGGWVLSSTSLQTVSSSIIDNLTGDKVNGMLTGAGVSQDYVIDLAVGSLKKVTVEQAAVATIRDGNGSLSLHCDGITLTFSAESLKNLSGTLEIRLNDAPLNDAQKASAKDRATYNLEIYSDGTKAEMLHGVVTVVLPFVPHSEAEKEKVQAWKIDSNGVAHTYKAAYSDNTISFATNTPGCYAISLDNVPSRSDVHIGSDYTLLIAGIGIAAAVIAGLLIYFFVIRKKR